jgi:outer membrane immunogenic protein
MIEAKRGFKMRAYVIAFTSLIALAATATPACAEGFRAEVHGGWDRVQSDGQREDGIVYGLGFGYDMDVGAAGFVGLDFSIDDSTTKECERGAIIANDRACLNAGRDLAAGVRAGLKVGDRGKVYALAGYSNARFKFSYTTPAGVTTRDAANLDGFRLGAGYEHGIGQNAYGKVEYRYSNYESDVTRHQVLVGVGLNF